MNLREKGGGSICGGRQNRAELTGNVVEERELLVDGNKWRNKGEPC